MASENHIQAIARFVVGFGTEQDDIWRDYNLDFAGKITYDGSGNPNNFGPVGNSGYSLGSLQWDFGQGPDLAGPFVEAFEDWIERSPPNATPLKSDPEFATRALALQGQALTANPSFGLRRQDVQALSQFVRTDIGSDWVNTNIDQNLIGSDQRTNVVVLGKTHGLSLVGVARKVETTNAFKKYETQSNADATNLIYAIGMKAYNQSPGSFTKKLLPFLAGDPSVADIAAWYGRFSGGLKSGVGAATALSQFWATWRAANLGPLRSQIEGEMNSQCLSNPLSASATSGAYVLAKQVFEDTTRFAKFAHAKQMGVDYVEPKLFDATTGAIGTHPVTNRLRPGLLVKNKIAYVWDAAGNAYSAAENAWTAIPVAKINIRKL